MTTAMTTVLYLLALGVAAWASWALGRRRQRLKNRAEIAEELRLQKAASLGQWRRR